MPRGQPGDHAGKQVSLRAIEAEHPRQRGGGCGAGRKIDLCIGEQVGDREHEIWENVVVDVLIGCRAAAEPAHHLPLFLHRLAIAAEIVDERRGAVLQIVLLSLFRDEAEATECRRVDEGQVVRLDGVLDRDLPVAGEVARVPPVAFVGGGERCRDTVEPLAEMVAERWALCREPNENEIAARLHRKGLQPGVLPVEGLEAATVRDLRHLAVRGILPAVILADDPRGVAMDKVGQQAVSVRADIQVGAEHTVDPAELNGTTDDFERLKITLACQIGGDRHGVPRGQEQPLDLALMDLRRCVVVRPEDVLELLLMNEHSGRPWWTNVREDR